MIDRVEVVRGGGSALFGASAIGGTINIITKEPIRNAASFGHTFMSQGGANSFDNVTMGNVSLVTDDNKAGVYAYGQTHTRQGYDHDGDGYTEVPELKSQTFGLNSYLRLSPYSKLSLQYHRPQFQAASVENRRLRPSGLRNHRFCQRRQSAFGKLQFLRLLFKR